MYERSIERVRERCVRKKRKKEYVQVRVRGCVDKCVSGI